MDKEQFMTILVGLKSNYPNWKIDLQDGKILSFWYENLKDIPYEIAQIGVKKLLAEEEFYPNIAKIRKACAEVTRKKKTDSTEGWGLVQQAIRMYGYMRADEALASLPEEVALAVKRMGGFQSLCESENIEADRAHFYRAIEQINERSKNESVLSLDLRQALQKYQLTNSEGVLQLGNKVNSTPMIEELDTSDIDIDGPESFGSILKRQIRGM